MAPVSGNITVTFIANYPTNNLYWREGCTGPYNGPILIDCTPLSGNFVAGTECSYTISPVTFENEDCDSICYDGYIEATCDAGNPLGYLFWQKDFVPVPECRPYQLSCVGTITEGTLMGIQVVTTGNYVFDTVGSAANCALATLSVTDPQAPGTSLCGNFNGRDVVSTCGSNAPLFCQCVFKPFVTVSPPPPGGVQATAEAVMGFGGLNKPAIIVMPGTGPITSNGTFTVPCNTATNYIPLFPSTVPGIGQQMFEVIVSAGQVTKVTPLLYPFNGAFFHSNEFFSFDPALIGGVPGVLCRPAPFSIDLGQIIAVEITNPGSGYPAFPLPTFTVSDTASSCDGLNLVDSAELRPVIGPSSSSGPCPEFDPGDNCAGDPYLIGQLIPEIVQGGSIQICYTSLPRSIPPEYSVQAIDNCCYDCIQIRVQADVSDPLPQIIYTNCDGQTIVIQTMTGYSLIINCAVRDSWYSSQSSTTFTELGPCIT